ncbi:MAG: MmgE/PrpD family protein [Eubacteriales bacterium]|nr:MmgE/PrpD family protein [Eubacteriales bacterium]
MNQLKHLAEFISEFQAKDCPGHVIEAAGLCVFDTVSAALGGSDNPMLKSIRKTFHTYENTAYPSSAVWGRDTQSASLRTAVFFNAMASHALELDDVHTGSKTHIGTVVIPAAWGLCEYLNKSGSELLEAVLCGYEVMARIGMGFGVSGHRNKGWHVTGTAGTFGAAAACGKLLGFSPEQMLYAFGLAGTQSCSTWAFLSDSATNKVLHPARAAASGLDSCLLVEGGMRGSAHILDAPDGGIFPMMSDRFDYSLVDKDLGSVYEIMNVDKKPYPCCRSIHCAIDAALQLKEELNPDPDSIESVLVETYKVGLKQCGLSSGSVRPQLPTEAKFSTPYAVACAFLTGNVGLADFEPSSIQRMERQKLLERVQVVENHEFTSQYPDHWGCRMTVRLKDGRSSQALIRDASGSVASPLSAEALKRKSAACCGAFPAEWVSQLQKNLLELNTANQLPSLALPVKNS